MLRRIMHSLLFTVLSLFAAHFASAQITPEDGKTYPVGTEMKLPCSCEGVLCHYVKTYGKRDPDGVTKKTESYLDFVKKSGEGWALVGGAERRILVGGFEKTDDPKMDRIYQECHGPETVLLTKQGDYRLSVRIDESESQPVGWPTKRSRQENVIYFNVGPANPCLGPANTIVSVKDGEGRELSRAERVTMALDGPSFTRGQTVLVPSSIPKGIEIQLGDGSVTRVVSGSKLRLNKCEFFKDTSPNFKMTLFIGKVWFHVQQTLGSDTSYEVQTDRAVTGNRGTTFSVAYNDKTLTTTVEVEEGSVWFRNKLGVPKTINVEAGQTAIQTGNKPPR